MTTTLLSEAFRNRQLTRKTQEERLARLTEERMGFQRQTLLELQEELSALIKLTGAKNRADTTWDDDALQQFDDRLLTVRVLKSRIEDNDIRHAATTVSNECIAARNAATVAEARRVLDTIWAESRVVNDKIGTWLQEH
jgi:hypothetical protein